MRKNSSWFRSFGIYPRWLLQNLPNLYFTLRPPVHIMRLEDTPLSLTFVRDPPPFRTNLHHVGAAGLNEGHVRGGIIVAVVFRYPRLFPAPHHLIILLVVHFVEASMMTATVAVEGSSSFKRMHHKTEASACAQERDFLRAWASWRNIGHLPLEVSFGLLLDQ